MSKLFLDLKSMKKLKSDGDTTVFEHKSGHQIHVKNSALSPKMREEMQKLTQKKKDRDSKSKEARQKFAEGTPDAPIQIATDPNQLEQAPLPEAPQMEATPARPADLPYGTEPDTAYGTQQPIAVAQAPQTDPNAIPESNSPEASTPPIERSPTEQAPQQAGPAQMPAQAPKAPPIDSGITPGVAKGIQEQRQGIEQEAKAKSQMAEQTANALASEQIKKDTADQVYQDQQTSLLKERDALMSDIKNNHIKPDAYLADKSVIGKISTAVGLILGGIGGGLLHQENPAMKFLNAQIDRNINAQQAELGKKENLLSANFRQFGNMQAARDFTRINHNDMIKNMIDQAAAKAGTPMAQAEALKAKGALDQQSGMLMAKIGAIQTLNNHQAKGGDVASALQTLRMVDPEKAKEVETRIVPGVGMAEVPLDKGTRDKILSHQQLDERARDLLQFAQQHTGSLDPRVRAEGQQKVLALQSLYREGMLNTVYREGEQPLLDKIVKDPTSFFNSVGNIPKLNELIKSNQARFGTLKDQIGLRPFPNSTQQMAPKRFVPAQSFKPRQ